MPLFCQKSCLWRDLQPSRQKWQPNKSIVSASRMNILTGDADNLPPDGEAMKLVIQQLEEQEKALTNLFTGIRAKEVSDYEVTIVPFDNLDKEVLFRFSPNWES